MSGRASYNQRNAQFRVPEPTEHRTVAKVETPGSGECACCKRKFPYSELMSSSMAVGVGTDTTGMALVCSKCYYK